MSAPSFLPPRSAAAVSTLLTTPSSLLGEHASCCTLTVVPVCEGVELAHWSSQCGSGLALELCDDSDRVHFTYTLSGSGECRFHRPAGSGTHEVCAAAGSVNYSPHVPGRFVQVGACESIAVMVRPDVLAHWRQGERSSLQAEFDGGHCFVGGLRHAALRPTAWQLAQDAGSAGGIRHRLWREGQAMAMVGLLLEASEYCPLSVSTLERRALMQARDRLLADLGNPPTIAELASATGISVLRLKRGFKALFGLGVFGVFQQERMHEARRQLGRDTASVTAIAMDLGYSNASHFAAAFRKQFGVNPAELLRSGPIRAPLPDAGGGSITSA